MNKKLILYILVFLYAADGFSEPPTSEGKTIFASRCASCHNVNKILVGPALAGVSDRHPESWIINFVHSSQTVIKSGDAKAIELYEKFNKVPMPDHPDLTAENIKDILAYVKSESKTTTETLVFRPEILHPAYLPVTGFSFFAVYLGLVVLLTASLVLLVYIKDMQRKRNQVKSVPGLQETNQSIL
jgi:cytochrome c551/c552